MKINGDTLKSLFKAANQDGNKTLTKSELDNYAHKTHEDENLQQLAEKFSEYFDKYSGHDHELDPDEADNLWSAYSGSSPRAISSRCSFHTRVASKGSICGTFRFSSQSPISRNSS